MDEPAGGGFGVKERGAGYKQLVCFGVVVDCVGVPTTTAARAFTDGINWEHSFVAV